MIRYLLPEQGHFYKANLHSHTVLSDGKKTPEELKEMYKAQGYSILSITDHEYMVRHNDLTDPDFLMLNGYEAYLKENLDGANSRFIKTVHLLLIAQDDKEERMIMVDPSYMKYAKRFVDVETLPRVGNLCSRQYTIGDVNRFIRQANEAGYIVIYNHPSWSREVPDTVAQYQGFMGMEVYNHGCHKGGYPDDDGLYFDGFLRAGRRIACFCNDDNHNEYYGTTADDSFGGFNMIKAPELTYDAVIKAIRARDFYCSNGALIDSLWLEDRTVHITFPAAREVVLVTEGRPDSRGRWPSVEAEPGKPLTHAEFELLEDDGYFRIEVIDFNGYKAYTQAYFLEDLF